MIRTLQIIYDKLHYANPRDSIYEVEVSQAIRFLTDKNNVEPGDGLYFDLIIQLNNLKTKYIPLGFVERFCLGKISDRILSKYPVNVIEAFVLSYAAINKPVELNTIYFKMGTSGLISPTKINGVRVDDVEAIAQFIIKSLADADMIRITDNRYIIFGKQFSIDM